MVHKRIHPFLFRRTGKTQRLLGKESSGSARQDTTQNLGLCFLPLGRLFHTLIDFFSFRSSLCKTVLEVMVLSSARFGICIIIMYGSHGFGFIGSSLRLAQVAQQTIEIYPGFIPCFLLFGAWADIIDLIGLLVRYGRASGWVCVASDIRDCYCNCRMKTFSLPSICLALPLQHIDVQISVC